MTAGVEYALAESTVAGYTAGSWSCTGGTFTSPNKVTLGSGTAVTCRLTNDDDKAAPVIRTAQGWILTDTAVITGLRTGATDAGMATMTFRLWSTKSAANVCSDQVGDDIVVTGVTTTSIATPSGITVTAPDTYYWTVAYSGDQKNAPFETLCGSESTTISAIEPAP